MSKFSTRGGTPPILPSRENPGNFNEVFLSCKCINKQVHELVHRQMYYIASSACIISMPFLVPTLVNCK